MLSAKKQWWVNVWHASCFCEMYMDLFIFFALKGFHFWVGSMCGILCCMLHVFLGVACHMFFGGVAWCKFFGEWNVICFLVGATLAQVCFALLLSSPFFWASMAGLQKAFFLVGAASVDSCSGLD